MNEMATDLNVEHENDIQLVITMLFLGLMAGQLFAGPLSDHFGRRPVVHIGYALFTIGSVLCIFAQSYSTMIAGRILQGVGAACPRIVTMAIVRDGYSGREMARIMSIVMMIFIMVPAIAPALGEVILLVGTWHTTFTILMLVGLLSWCWFSFRMPETLAIDNRIPLNRVNIQSGLRYFFSSKIALGYTIANGWVLGVFISYLGTAQQVFQQTYNTGQWFAFWFALAAIAIGASSALNATLVIRLGMRKLAGIAVRVLAGVSAVFLVYVLTNDGIPAFSHFMTWLLIAFSCIGTLFANLNALAMEPLGKLAGLGAALVGSISTLMALPIAWFIGQSYNGGVTALVCGFATMSLAALICMHYVDR